MNVLDKIKSVLNMENVVLGYMPDKPDGIIGLFEYEGSPPEHYFGSTNIVENVQVRVRDISSLEAYDKAKIVASALNRYHDNEISVLQSTPILDIGYDNANPQRQEYTVNFIIRRY